jgi:hypothetical protein
MEKQYRWAKVLNGDPRIDSYKWEFLRRNQEFQRDYAALANQFPEWIAEHGGLVGSDSTSDQGKLSFYREYVLPAASKITERWWVIGPVHPTLSSIPNQVPPEVDPPSFYNPHEVESGSVWAVTERFSHTPGPFTPRELRFLVTQIDIAQPLETIFAELEFWIENAKSRYRTYIGPLPSFRKRRRARLEEYDSYLRVWDLRMQGFTFERIAFQLFPREMRNEGVRGAMTKRVRSQFQRAKKLIEGEYRQIGG